MYLLDLPARWEILYASNIKFNDTFSSCSLTGFFDKWQLNYLAAGCSQSEMINYQQLRYSWYAYLSLLDIDYKSGFFCDICGAYPDVITCDATTLGFKRIFVPNLAKIKYSEHELDNQLEGR